jgi:flagellar biosynthesis/type III secretory pathway chaperone
VASLVEELVKVLETEEEMYQELIESAGKKTEVLIRADVPALEQLTNQEQLISDRLNSQGNQQRQLLTDIAVVLGKPPETMTVTRLIGLLDTQPKMQTQLTSARDRLIDAANKVKSLNDQNVVLIQQAIELNEFDLTLFKSMRQAPETANYDKSACNTGTLLGSSGFDATS